MSRKLSFLSFLFILFVTVSAYSGPHFKNILGLPGKNIKNSNNSIEQKGLGKISAIAALKWQQIGASHYTSSGNQENPEPWNFSSRDTSIFDNLGKLIVSKTSCAHAGWGADSLTMLDSSVYNGGQLTEMIYKYSDPLEPENFENIRIVFEYLNGGKTVVGTSYDFDSTDNTWILSSKDSIIFKNAVTNIYPDGTFAFEESFSFLFDTTDSKWKTAGHLAKISSECNATTLTFGGNVPENDSSEVLMDVKYRYSFITTDFTIENVSGTVFQIKNRSTGTYYEASRSSITVDVNGTKINQITEMDSTSSNILSDTKYLTSPDAHGFDTLQMYLDYDPTAGVWDTVVKYRYTRSYDNKGNNSETVESFYSSTFDGWFVSGKDVNIFAQFDVPVVRLNKTGKKSTISIMSKHGIVSVNAPDVTGLLIYNANGRLIASSRQSSSSSISIDLSAFNGHLAAGVYFAKAICKNGQYTIELSINR
jgi:hypothetical protein